MSERIFDFCPSVYIPSSVQLESFLSLVGKYRQDVHRWCASVDADAPRGTVCDFGFLDWIFCECGGDLWKYDNGRTVSMYVCDVMIHEMGFNVHFTPGEIDISNVALIHSSMDIIIFPMNWCMQAVANHKGCDGFSRQWIDVVALAFRQDDIPPGWHPFYDWVRYKRDAISYDIRNMLDMLFLQGEIALYLLGGDALSLELPRDEVVITEVIRSALPNKRRS